MTHLNTSRAVARMLPVPFALLLGACGAGQDPGPDITQTREVGAFEALQLQGTADVDVLIGEQQSLVLEGPQRVVEGVQTPLREGRLLIRTGSEFFWSRRDTHLKVRVTVPRLRSFELNGAGRVSLIGHTGGDFTVSLNGAGDIEASGRVDRLTARVNGAGNVDLSKLAATDADVAVNGAGSLEVSATGRLDATLNGVGNIGYVGTPAQLHTAVHGVGGIKPRR
jgi:hypothetical protein